MDDRFDGEYVFSVKRLREIGVFGEIWWCLWDLRRVFWSER